MPQDKVTKQEVQEIKEDIVNINPRANIHLTDHARISLRGLQENYVEARQRNNEAIEVDKHLHIQTLAYTFNVPIHKAAFEKWLRTIPSTIYRMKGFIEFIEFPQQTIHYQYSFGGATYLPIKMNLPNTIVIIGNHLDKNKILKELVELENILNISGGS